MSTKKPPLILYQKSYSTLFIEKVKDAEFSLNEINAWLVVMEVNERPSDLLTHIFILLQLEHMLQHPVASVNIRQTVNKYTTHRNAISTHKH